MKHISKVTVAKAQDETPTGANIFDVLLKALPAKALKESATS